MSVQALKKLDRFSILITIKNNIKTDSQGNCIDFELRHFTLHASRLTLHGIQIKGETIWQQRK